ncbi:alpha/beta hydrolase [Streptomyces sodiiphilus]|uniref:Alpha/beta hydrolase n=1 Tax=Streptomyces sodiiphilus TaxID=226217 RepID=A0ABP5AIG9_9ACTN
MTARTRRSGPRPQNPAGPGIPCRETTVTSTGGARLHVEIHGPDDAPTVVLAHGWTCNTTFWYPVTRLLAEDHRVVLYDQRGHGRTPATPGSCGTEALADDLCAVLDAVLEPGQKAVVGGHSMGAMTIVAAAPRDCLRERAVAAMLCSTGVSRLSVESRVIALRGGKKRHHAHRLLLGSALPFGPVTPLSKRLLRYVTMGPEATAEQRTEVARIVHACARRPRAEWGKVLGRLDLLDRAADLTVPSVVLYGTADRLTPPVHAHRLAGALPDTTLVELPRMGHMTPIEDTGTVADALRGLVRVHLKEGAPGAAGINGGESDSKVTPAGPREGSTTA